MQRNVDFVANIQSFQARRGVGTDAQLYSCIDGKGKDTVTSIWVFILGKIYHIQRNYEEAFRFYLQTIKLDPCFGATIFWEDLYSEGRVSTFIYLHGQGAVLCGKKRKRGAVLKAMSMIQKILMLRPYDLAEILRSLVS